MKSEDEDEENGEEEEEDEETDEDEGWVNQYDIDGPESKAAAQLFHRFSDIEEVLQTVFGDHSQITVTKDGITVDEYEHD